MSKKGPLLISTYKEVLGLDKQITFIKKSAREILIAIKAAQKEGYEVQFDKDISEIYTPHRSLPLTKEQNQLKQQVETWLKKPQSIQPQEMPKEKAPSDDPAAQEMAEVMNLLRGDKATKGIVKECEKLYRKYQEATRDGAEPKKLEAVNAFYRKVKDYSDKQAKKYSKEKGTVGMVSGFRAVGPAGKRFYAPSDTANFGTEVVRTNPVITKIKEESLAEGVVKQVEDARRYHYARVQMKKLAAKFMELIRQGQSPHAKEKARIASKLFKRLHDDPKLYEFLQGKENFPKKEVRKGFETEEINAEKFLEMLKQLEGNETVFLSDMAMMRSEMDEREITKWNYSDKGLTKAPTVMGELLAVAARRVNQEAQKAVKPEQPKAPKQGMMNLFSKQRSKPKEVTDPNRSVSSKPRKPGKRQS